MTEIEYYDRNQIYTVHTFHSLLVHMGPPAGPWGWRPDYKLISTTISTPLHIYRLTFCYSPGLYTVCSASAGLSSAYLWWLEGDL